MRVKIDGIASITGMSAVFVLRCVDIVRWPVDRGYVTPPPRGTAPANAVSLLTAEMAACEELSMLLDITLKGLAQHLYELLRNRLSNT